MQPFLILPPPCFILEDATTILTQGGEQIIGNVTSGDGLDRIRGPYTGDDIFTAMHQNELNVLSKLTADVFKKNAMQYNKYCNYDNQKSFKIKFYLEFFYWINN